MKEWASIEESLKREPRRQTPCRCMYSTCGMRSYDTIIQNQGTCGMAAFFKRAPFTAYAQHSSLNGEKQGLRSPLLFALA